MPTKPLHSCVDSWGKAFVEVRIHMQLFEYSVIVDRQNAQKSVLPCSLDSALPKERLFATPTFLPKSSERASRRR